MISSGSHWAVGRKQFTMSKAAQLTVQQCAVDAFKMEFA